MILRSDTLALARSFGGHIEIMRAGAGGDGRTVCGICVPYDTPQEIPGARIVETWRAGVFGNAHRDPQRVKMFAQHAHRSDEGALPVGRATLLRDDRAGLYGEFRISRTEAGDEFLELIADGVVDQLSVGARQIAGGMTATPTRGRAGWLDVVRTRAHLVEVSGVWEGAFGEAAPIMAVRSNGADPAAVERLEHARAELAAMAARRAALQGSLT